MVVGNGMSPIPEAVVILSYIRNLLGTKECPRRAHQGEDRYITIYQFAKGRLDHQWI